MATTVPVERLRDGPTREAAIRATPAPTARGSFAIIPSSVGRRLGVRVQEGGVGAHMSHARAISNPRFGDAVDRAGDKWARLHLVHDVVVEVVLVHLEHALGVAEVDAVLNAFARWR